MIKPHSLSRIRRTQGGGGVTLWAIARNFATGSQRVTSELREGVARVFAEDEAMLNAQQAAIDANPGHDFYNLNIDAGGMWARRLITAMVERERM